MQEWTSIFLQYLSKLLKGCLDGIRNVVSESNPLVAALIKQRGFTCRLKNTEKQNLYLTIYIYIFIMCLWISCTLFLFSIIYLV